MGSYKWIISPLIWVITTATLLITLLITTHEPQVRGDRISGLKGKPDLRVGIWDFSLGFRDPGFVSRIALNCQNSETSSPGLQVPQTRRKTCENLYHQKQHPRKPWPQKALLHAVESHQNHLRSTPSEAS